MIEVPSPRAPSVIDASKASSPAAAAIAAMRAVQPDGPPVPAEQVRAWADSLMPLYEAKPVLWQSRFARDNSPGCWSQADWRTVLNGHLHGRVLRALYEHPPVPKPTRAHVWIKETGVCKTCNINMTFSGPDCIPPEPPPFDSRDPLPVPASWFIEPLEALRDMTKGSTRFDARKWNTESDYLLQRLRSAIKEQS